jgi:hypothetical protein
MIDTRTTKAGPRLERVKAERPCHDCPGVRVPGLSYCRACLARKKREGRAAR